MLKSVVRCIILNYLPAVSARKIRFTAYVYKDLLTYAQNHDFGGPGYKNANAFWDDFRYTTQFCYKNVSGSHQNGFTWGGAQRVYTCYISV